MLPVPFIRISTFSPPREIIDAFDWPYRLKIDISRRQQGGRRARERLHLRIGSPSIQTLNKYSDFIGDEVSNLSRSLTMQPHCNLSCNFSSCQSRFRFEWWHSRIHTFGDWVITLCSSMSFLFDARRVGDLDDFDGRRWSHLRSPTYFRRGTSVFWNYLRAFLVYVLLVVIFYWLLLLLFSKPTCYTQRVGLVHRKLCEAPRPELCFLCQHFFRTKKVPLNEVASTFAHIGGTKSA